MLGILFGVWLGLIIVNIWFSDWVVDYSVLVVMVGVLFVFVLIILIVGLCNFIGLLLVVFGMVVNILLGLIVMVLVLLNEEFV